MKNRIQLYPVIFILTLMLAGCTDKIDLENISNKYTYDGGFAFPGVQGTFTTMDMFNPESDSNFVFYGEDSIILSIRQDDAFNFGLNDFLNSEQTLSQLLGGFSLPPQTLSNPFGDVGPFPSDTYYSDIDSTTFYPSFQVIQEVEMDSLILNSGSIDVDVTNSFEPDIYLSYRSNSIMMDGQPLYDSILITEDGTQSIPLDGATIIFQQSGTDDTDSVYFDITYYLSMDIKAGESLNDGDQIELAISMDNLDDYDYIFGYFGDIVVKEFDELDTFSLNLPELMNKLEGEYNIGNPRVNLFYQNSFGFEQLLEIGIQANLNNGSQDSALFEPPATILKPNRFDNNPSRNDTATMNAGSLNNLFGELPPPKIYSAAGNISINPDGRTVNDGYINFVRPNSRLKADMELEIPMEFGANMLYADTVPAEDFISIPDFGDHIEYARMHYLFENGFPLGLDVRLIMLDTVNLQHVDTISFNEAGDFFVEGAPVNNQGVVTEVNERTGIMEVTQEQIQNLKNNADKVILNIRLITTGENVDDPVKLEPNNSLYYRLGLEVKITADDYFEN